MPTTSQIDPTSDESDIVRNARRAAWARLALETFAAATGLDLDPEHDGPETAIGDLLTDLRHYVAALGLDFDEMSDRSAYRFADEISDQGGDNDPGGVSPTELHALFSIALEQERSTRAVAPEQGAIITEPQRRADAAEMEAWRLAKLDNATEETDAEWRRQQGKADAYGQALAVLTGIEPPRPA